VLRRLLSRKHAGLAVLCVALAGGVYVFSALVSTLSSARHSLNDATVRVSHEGEIAFRSILLDRPVPAGFEPVSSPAQFSDAVLFAGRFYVCGPGGLLAFDLNGTLIAQYRPGMELPASPLVRMAVGAASDSSGPQLWIATSTEGLLAFDGRAFRQIRGEQPGARQLTAVLSIATGRILLGTERAGILVWDGHALSQLHPALAGEHITALAGTEADLWAGTIDRGVIHWHAGQLDHFAENHGLPDPRVLSLAYGPVSVYVGTPLGVAEFRDGRFARVFAAGLFAKSLLVRHETLSIGTLEEGVIEVPLTAQRPRPHAAQVSTELGAVERLVDIEDHVYALSDAGVFERTQSRGDYRLVFEVPGARLTDRNISALSIDRSGKLWVGYFDRGLDVVDPSFDHKTHFEDDHLFCVNRIAPDEAGSLTAVATANGLVLFDASQKPRRVLGKAEGLIANHITDVLLRNSGFTVATPAGLTMIDASGTTSLYAFHGLVNNHVYSLAASGSRLLAGTLGGLSILDSGTVTASYTTANSGLKHNWITAIAKVDNDWFLGTYGAGVLMLDTAGRWTSFPDFKGELVINPNALAVTPGAVYAGTLGQGLAVYSRGSGRWARVTTGLPSLNVTALTSGGGYLYIGTDNGLVRIPESQVPTQ
jgi:ligand-binding sensor domain-containing protein